MMRMIRRLTPSACKMDGYGAVFRAIVPQSAIATLARLLALLALLRLLALAAAAADLDQFVVEFRKTSNHDALSCVSLLLHRSVFRMRTNSDWIKKVSYLR